MIYSSRRFEVQYLYVAKWLMQLPIWFCIPWFAGFKDPTTWRTFWKLAGLDRGVSIEQCFDIEPRGFGLDRFELFFTILAACSFTFIACPNKVVCWWAQHICKAKDEEHHKNLEDPVACNSGGFNFVSSCVSFRVNWMYSSWAQIRIASVAQQESQVLYLVGCHMLIVLCSFQPHLAWGIQLAWCPKFWSMLHFAHIHCHRGFQEATARWARCAAGMEGEQGTKPVRISQLDKEA